MYVGLVHVGDLQPTNAGICEFAKSHYRFKIMWSTNVPSPENARLQHNFRHRLMEVAVDAGTLKSSMAQVTNADSVCWWQGGAVYMVAGASVTFTSCSFTSDAVTAVSAYSGLQCVTTLLQSVV